MKNFWVWVHFLENYLDFWHNEAIFAYKMQKRIQICGPHPKGKKESRVFPLRSSIYLTPFFLLLCICQNLGKLCFIYLLIKIWCFELKLSAKLCAVCRCKINFSLLISHSVRAHKITFMHGYTYVFVASIVRQMTFKLSL